MDSRGFVVGINTAVFAMAQGISFAVPIDTAAWVIPQLLTHGRVRRPYLGFGGQSRPVDVRLARSLGLLNVRAVEVMSVEPGTPAAGELHVGDLVAAIGGRAVESVDDVHRELLRRAIGEPLSLTVVRAGSRMDLNVAPTEMP